MDIEKPSEDVLEQERDLVERDEDAEPRHADIPFDVNEADAADQERAVDTGDEDYR